VPEPGGWAAAPVITGRRSPDPVTGQAMLAPYPADKRDSPPVTSSWIVRSARKSSSRGRLPFISESRDG
jgi:hypothetical protein